MSDLFSPPTDPEPRRAAGGKSFLKWPAGSVVSADFSPCGEYRYSLSEVWRCDKPLVLWMLMNPSVASVAFADPTLIRTGGFARRWGYGGQLIGNMHAYRATDSRRLLEVSDPVGPANDAAILSMASRAAVVVLAYGQPPKPLRARAERVIRMLSAYCGVPPTYLALPKDGTPKHPLYLPGNLTPIVWEGCCERA